MKTDLSFFVLFSVLCILYFAVGYRASKKVKTTFDYFLGGKQIGTIPITCNLIATQLGGGLLLGTAATAYRVGFYGIFYTLGMVIGFLILGIGVASRLQQFQVSTTAELFETQYGSPGLRRLASTLSLCTLFGILVAQVVGIQSLLVSLGVPTWGVLLAWMSIVVYTSVGGLRAITVNDMIQLFLITVTFGITWVLFGFKDVSPAEFFSKAFSGSSFQTEQMSFNQLTSLILMPALFSLIEQDLAQRFFASRSRTGATRAAFSAGAFLLIFAFIPVYFGMLAKMTGIFISPTENPLLVYLRQSAPPFLFSFILCAITAAIISTADALINGISANLMEDFGLSRRLGSQALRGSKLITLMIGVGAWLFSRIASSDVISTIVDSYGLSVGCLLVSLLVCYYKKVVNRRSAQISVIAGLCGFCFGKMTGMAFPSEWLALALSGMGYGVGELLQTRRSS